MTFEVHQRDDAKELEILVKGRFQFACHRDFRAVYIDCIEPGYRYRVNLAHTEYMDSAALGMLLLLNEHAKQHRQSVVLASPPTVIRRILDIARFDKVFQIED